MLGGTTVVRRILPLKTWKHSPNIVCHAPCVQERRALSVSIGGPYQYTLNEAVNTAVTSGAVVVTSAGNEATSACDRSPASASGSKKVV
jgi:hypothetical protein